MYRIIPVRETVLGNDQAESKSGSHAHAYRDILGKGTTGSGGRGRCSTASSRASNTRRGGGVR